MGADPDVVRDLDLIVELDAVFDDGIVERAAVDRGVGADFDVIADQHPSDLGNFFPYAILPRDAETVGADHDAGMHDTARADPAFMVDRHVGMQPGLPAPMLAPSPIKHPGPMLAPSAICAPLPITAQAPMLADFATRADLSTTADLCMPGFNRGRRIEQRRNLGEIGVGIGADDARQAARIARLGAEYDCAARVWLS